MLSRQHLCSAWSAQWPTSSIPDFCTAAGFASDFCDVAVLLVDELVEKTLVDDEAAATVEIQRAGAGLRIGVRDATARIPAQRRASTHDPGTVTELGPKIVWFEIHTVRG